MTFNLTTEPWIPCELLDGARTELSTREVLVRAHEIKALAESSPLTTAALHRHLLAVLHRAYEGPRSLSEWTAIARPGAFDAPRIDAYLGQVKDRMDLFHPTHPFAQTRGLKEQFATTPIDELEVERSAWGPGRELFQARPEDHHASFTPARAARALITHHAFATGGLVRKPNEPTAATAAPLVRSAVILPRRDTLFGTLLANLMVYDPVAGKPITGGADDRPAWEQDPPPRELRRPDEPKNLPRGWLDLLTWLSRRIELVVEGDRVTGFVRAVWQGLHEQSPHDPMVTYRVDEKRGTWPHGLNPDRMFWRDAHALFQATEEAKATGFERAKNLGFLSQREVLAVFGKGARFRIEILGMFAEKSRVDLTRTERLATTADALADPAAREAVKSATHHAEERVKALKSALWVYASKALSPGDRSPDTKDVNGLIQSLGADAAAWSALGQVFEVFVGRLDQPDALDTFKADTDRAIRRCFQDATAGGTSTARWLKALALAELNLNRHLASEKAA